MTRLIVSAVVVLGLVPGFAAAAQQDRPPEAVQEDTKPGPLDLLYKRELSWSELLEEVTRRNGFRNVEPYDVSGVITIRIRRGDIVSRKIFSALVLDDGRYRVYALGSGEITGRIKPEDYVALEKRVRALDERPCKGFITSATGAAYYGVYTRTEPHSLKTLMSGEIDKVGCDTLKHIDPEIARILSLNDLIKKNGFLR